MARKALRAKTREWLSDKLIVASVSGGKDSTALSLWLTENGVRHSRIFMDTGWEHPSTYQYINEVLVKALGPITVLKSKVGGMKELVEKKGLFPSRVTRFCTTELKVKPAIEHIRKLMDSSGLEVINAVGIRGGESEARAKMPEVEYSEAFDCEVWRPLLHWTEQDVIAMHTECGVPPNPLYLQDAGVNRVGCWPCIFSRKAEIRRMVETTPWRVDDIREMEKKVTAKYRARHAGEGAGVEPSFFQSRVGNRDGVWLIDDVVEWCKSGRSSSYEPFDDSERGCVRWGLCESNPDDE